MIVTTAAQLAEVIEEYSQYDEFVVDLETMYIPTPEERAEADRIAAITMKNRTVDEAKWYDVFKFKATDPRVNTIIWIGLAGPGGSSHSIPVGHPKGKLLTHQRVVNKPAFEVFEDGDPRRMTKQGKLSKRKIKVTLPATFAPPPKQLLMATVIDALRPLFFNVRKCIIGWNLKFDIKTLAKYFGTVDAPQWPTGHFIDVMLAVHMIDEKRRDYKLENVTKDHFDMSYEKLGSKGVENFSFGRAAKYTVQDCRYEWLIWLDYKALLQRKESLWRFFNDYEEKFYRALMIMEWEGVEVDRAAVAALRIEKVKEVRGIIDRLIVDYGAPTDFNPNAATQVRELLYKKYRAPVTKKTEKTGVPSTDAETLEKIAEMQRVLDDGTVEVHKAAPVAQLLLDYAEQNKILSTYLVGTIPRLDNHDRLHADYILHGTETSRTSCREPNIQNIPRESEMRGMYRAPAGHVMVIGDYDQIELRFIAYLAQDEAMMELFISGQDIHRGTAANVLGKEFDDVDGDERQTYGKMPNFLLGYGGSALNLSEKTGIPLKRAEKVLDAYFRAFPAINPWKYRVIRQARNRGRIDNGRMVAKPWVETMLGRRRRLPDLLIGTRQAMRAAERQAVNTITQGSAAETALLALVAVTDYQQETGFPMRPVLTVHDEIACTVPAHLADEAKETLADLMGAVTIPHTGAKPLGDELPLAVKVVVAERWLK